jgi:cystathionine beta-lyase/cystathionine gamma-synthase
MHQGKINLVHGSELYYDSPKIFKYLETNGFLTKYQIDVNDSKSIIELFETKIKDQVNVLFIESCSNSLGFIFAPSIVDDLRKLSAKLYVVQDNTWLTACILNPFEYYGADQTIVVTSLT